MALQCLHGLRELLEDGIPVHIVSIETPANVLSLIREHLGVPAGVFPQDKRSMPKSKKRGPLAAKAAHLTVGPKRAGGRMNLVFYLTREELDLEIKQIQTLSGGHSGEGNREVRKLENMTYSEMKVILGGGGLVDLEQGHILSEAEQELAHKRVVREDFLFPASFIEGSLRKRGVLSNKRELRVAN